MNTLACMFTILLVVMATMTEYRVQGQSYHFSNGWNPGKRSHSPDMCHFRPEVKALVFKLIEDEVLRMMSDPTCEGGLSSQRSLLKKDISDFVPIVDERK